MDVGLASNVGLTISKGLAGLWMNSASLLAEAGHSLSDLLGVSQLTRTPDKAVTDEGQDFVTLATWRISRKQPTDTFPWGYSKFETFGTLSVSIILGMFSDNLIVAALNNADPDSSGRCDRNRFTFISRTSTVFRHRILA